MKRMTIQDAKAMAPEAIEAKVVELKKELLNLRFQLATGNLENTAEIKKAIQSSNFIFICAHLSAYQNIANILSSTNIGNAEIFEFVLEKNNLNPKETVFIDDSVQHVKGAGACGINAFLLPKNVVLAP